MNIQSYALTQKGMEVYMLRKYVEFIVNNGGSDYYAWLLENLGTADIAAEMEDIKDLFRIWLKEFDWSKTDADFMKEAIESHII